MKSEKIIRQILKQYKFNLEMDKIYYPMDLERLKYNEHWIKCLEWVLDVESSIQSNK